MYFGPEISVNRFKQKIESGNTFPLREREIEVMKKRLKGETLEQVGNYFGNTRERIRQIETMAMAKMYFNIEIPLQKYGKLTLLESNRFILNNTEFIFGADLDWDEDEYIRITFKVQSKKSNIDPESFVIFIKNELHKQNRLRNIYGTKTLPFEIIYKGKGE